MFLARPDPLLIVFSRQKRATVMMDTYDVLNEVTRYGICSPYNSHSYRGSLILLPCVCLTCKQTIYPLITSAVTCIRCLSITHRGACMRSTKQRCPKVNRRREARTVLKVTGKETLCLNPEIVINEEELILKVTSSVDNGDHEVENSVVTKENDEVPAPGSADCIWRKNLQQLADDQSYTTKYSGVSLFSQSNSFTEESQLALATLIISALQDVESFPGKVCHTLHTLFLNTHFGHDRSTLQHARECLDSVACAVLSILPLDVTDSNQKLTEAVSDIVDTYVLEFSHRAMYCKAFLAAQLICDADDQKLISVFGKRLQSVNDNGVALEVDQFKQSTCTQCESAKSILLSATTAVSPRAKLLKFRIALQVISSSINQHSYTHQRENSSVVDSCSANFDDDSLVKDSDEEHKINYCENSTTDADALVELISTALLETINIGTLASGEKYSPAFWFAECCFILSMMREGDWSLGIDSYALTTIMQALRSLIQ